MRVNTGSFNFVPLKSLGRFLRGKGISKADVIEAGVGAVLYSELYTRFDGVISKPVSFVD